MALIFAFSAMPSDGDRPRPADARPAQAGPLRRVLRADLPLVVGAAEPDRQRAERCPRASRSRSRYAITDEIHQTFVDGRVGTSARRPDRLRRHADAAWLTVGRAERSRLEAWRGRAARQRRQRAGLDPAALGGDQYGLRAVDGAELP